MSQPPTPDHGPRAWRGLEAMLGAPAFAEMMQREFPDQAAEWTDPVTRRHFLALAGASLALAGVTGCSVKPAPQGKIVPYVRQPEGLIPGKPLFYATTMSLGGVATGLLVESREGRPIKIEGNPQHPASLGATDALTQAAILGLWDPDRSQAVTFLGRPSAWDNFQTAARVEFARHRANGGAGLVVLTETVASPTLYDQIAGQRPGALLHEFPQAKWYQYEPVNADNVHEGARLAFGEPLHTVHDFTKADVVLALDADFLGCWPGSLKYTRDFTSRRRPGQEKVARLYAVESTPSLAGAVADHRLPLRPRDLEGFARALAAEVARRLQDRPSPARDLLGKVAAAEVPEATGHWLRALAADLVTGRSLILVGPAQPPFLHALVQVLNQALGNVGQTVHYTAPLDPRPTSQTAGLRELAEQMAAGKVETLLILGGNPVFTAPADLEFRERMQKVKLRIHLGLYQDETAVQCHWHLPEAHFLEAWGDGRAFDGTASLAQPLIAPLYGGRSAMEVVASLSGDPLTQGYAILRRFWQANWLRAEKPQPMEQAWAQALHDGVIPNSAFPRRQPPDLRPQWATQPPPPAPAAGELDLLFQPDATIYDGRFANNGWLQELPKPLTRLTWDNAVFVSPATAERLGLWPAAGLRAGEHGQALVPVVRVIAGGRSVEAPAWVVPGHADDAITVQFGYGRTRAGTVGGSAAQPVGFNAYALRTSAAPWFAGSARLEPTGQRMTLGCVQMHHAMEDRAPVRTGTFARFQAEPQFLKHQDEAKEKPANDRRLIPLTLYPDHPTEGAPNQWGMAIDLTACVGCGACVVACQAENNIPVVGKAEVIRGREMHWLRIDTYHVGEPFAGTDLQTYFQPVPCMHCEHAPCELVCPVGATVHSNDGLNDMVYNRCVGTRYCSNNCPYKVRRFNFFQYADYVTKSLRAGRNPDVTVRSLGVMEKCTYCVQRIRTAQIEAEVQDRPVRDGDVLTACQAACPAQAIVFGDLKDKQSQVVKRKAEPLNYALLAELHTNPRTTYLAALRNPNPALEEA